MLGTVSIDCLSDVNISSSPAISDGQILVWNEDDGEWQNEDRLQSPDWEDITLAATFSNFSASYRSPRASVNDVGQVTIEAQILGTNLVANTTIATLDAEYRPDHTVAFSGVINNLGTLYPAQFTIITSGEIQFSVDTSGWSGTSGSFSFMYSYYKT